MCFGLLIVELERLIVSRQYFRGHVTAFRWEGANNTSERNEIAQHRQCEGELGVKGNCLLQVGTGFSTLDIARMH